MINFTYKFISLFSLLFTLSFTVFGQNSPSGCLFDYSEFGASDCSEAYIHFGFTYSELELNYGWDCSGCMDELALISGCMDELACNYNSDAIYEDICPTCSCVYIEPNDSCSVCSGESDGTGTIVDNDIDNDGICDEVGCTDNEAINFNPAATLEDGSCQFVQCLQTAALLTLNSGPFGSLVSFQITDLNNQILAALPEDGGSLVSNTDYEIDLCLSDANSYTAILSSPSADGWQGGSFEISTCDGQLIASSGTLGEDLESGSSVNTCGTTYVCDGTSALGNAFWGADCPDGSDEILGYCCYNDFFAYVDLAACDGVEEVLGYQYQGNESSIDFTVQDCDTYVFGCTDSSAFNYDSLANTDNGSCEDIVYGCTDNTANNYNPDANIDDSSCTFDVLGCTDDLSNNYNPEANIDDDSCQYDSSSNQIIPLVSGWSSFSSYISPEASSIDIVLSEIYENVIIAKDYLGQAYLPDWNFNAIGDLNHNQGYQIKLAQEDTLNIEGTYVSPEENPNILPSGWFMMGYLRLESVPMDLLLADLAEEQYITIVKDYLGQAYLPDWNFNAIGDAKPGFGYQIKTTQECTLEYLPNNMSYRLASSLKVIENRSSYFPKATVTDNNMTLIIEDGAWDVLPNQNTEIQALDSENNIVGSALYTSPTTVITLWGDDRYTSKKDGLDINEQVQYKLWDREKIRDFVIKDWVKGSSAYQINAINIASSIVTENSTLEANDTGTKSLVKIINLLGQEVQEENIDRTGQFLFKVYDDGSVERFIK